MSQNPHSVNQIVAKQCKADAEVGKGKKTPEVCSYRVNEKPVHRLWKQEHMQIVRKQHRKRRFPGGGENSCVCHRADVYIWQRAFREPLIRCTDGRWDLPPRVWRELRFTLEELMDDEID